MLRITSVAFVLFTALLISIGVLPSSSAEAGYYGTRYGGFRGGAVYGPRGDAVAYRNRRVAFRGPYNGYAYRDGYGFRAGHYGGYGYRTGYYGGYRSAYYGPRYYGHFYRPFVTAPYYVNGCYNGYSDHGVYCHYFEGCPFARYQH
jgi:hypothetical protein